MPLSGLKPLTATYAPAAALHAAFGAKAPHHHLCRLGDFLSQLLKLAAEAGVEHHVADPQPEAAEDPFVDLSAKIDRAFRLTLDLGADALNQLRVELDGTRQRHL